MTEFRHSRESPVLSRRTLLATVVAVAVAGCSGGEQRPDAKKPTEAEPETLRALGLYEKVRSGRVEFFVGCDVETMPFDLSIDQKAFDAYAQQLEADHVIPEDSKTMRLAFIWPGEIGGSEYLCEEPGKVREDIIVLQLATNAALHIPDTIADLPASHATRDNKTLEWLQQLANDVAWHEPAHIMHCQEKMPYKKAEPLAEAYEKQQAPSHKPFILLSPNERTPQLLTAILQRREELKP